MTESVESSFIPILLQPEVVYIPMGRGETVVVVVYGTVRHL
jgi:hypothetical protein